jgi:hypothetical protein
VTAALRNEEEKTPADGRRAHTDERGAHCESLLSVGAEMPRWREIPWCDLAPRAAQARFPQSARPKGEEIYELPYPRGWPVHRPGYPAGLASLLRRICTSVARK